MENKYVCSVDIGGTKIATAIMEYLSLIHI